MSSHHKFTWVQISIAIKHDDNIWSEHSCAKPHCSQSIEPWFIPIYQFHFELYSILSNSLCKKVNFSGTQLFHLWLKRPGQAMPVFNTYDSSFVEKNTFRPPFVIHISELKNHKHFISMKQSRLKLFDRNRSTMEGFRSYIKCDITLLIGFSY